MLDVGLSYFYVSLDTSTLYIKKHTWAEWGDLGNLTEVCRCPFTGPARCAGANEPPGQWGCSAHTAAGLVTAHTCPYSAPHATYTVLQSSTPYCSSVSPVYIVNAVTVHWYKYFCSVFWKQNNSRSWKAAEHIDNDRKKDNFRFGREAVKALNRSLYQKEARHFWFTCISIVMKRQCYLLKCLLVEEDVTKTNG